MFADRKNCKNRPGNCNRGADQNGSEELEKSNLGRNVSWLFYATDSKIQLRLEGTAVLIDGEEADEAWAQTSTFSRSAYVSIASPGTVAAGGHPPDTSDRVVTPAESERGRTNFRIVRTTVAAADCLYLRQEGHVRARLIYHPSGQCDCQWLVP